MNPKLRCVAAAVVLSALVALSAGARIDAIERRLRRHGHRLPPIKAPEVSPKDRAALHADLGAGYYERGRMDVAIGEAHRGRNARSRPIRGSTTISASSTRCSARMRRQANFQRALSLAPADSDVRHNWGWYLCSNDRPRESIPEFEIALRNPFYKTPEVALTNAGRCSAAFGDIAGAEAFYRRALARSPANAPAMYGLALLAFKGGRLDEARGYTRQLAQLPAPAPEALYLGMCVERKAGDRAAETLYVAQLRNRYPDSAEAKAVTTGLCE
jgi:type IV pilus assembly protein PilF